MVPALLMLDCASSSDDDAGGGGVGPPGSPADGGVGVGGAGGGAGSSGSGGDAGQPPPPEQEIESSFRSPVATSRFVWSANPDSGRVALVDAITLEVLLVEAGNGPTYLAGVPDADNPDADAAIVINELGDDATYLEVADDGSLSARTAELHRGANSWAISQGGQWAIAWTRSDDFDNPDPTQGFQDITVVETGSEALTSTRLSVGYRPTRLFIADDESRAFAVTEPGISVIELDSALGPRVLEDIPVTDDPLEDPASRDVSITPDGAYALIRRDGSADVGVVNLGTGERVVVTLDGAVTDLDLTSDGSSAVAVVRETATVAILPIPAIATSPDQYESVTITDEVVGSVAISEGGSTALLFTNATPNDHLTILNTTPGDDFATFRTVALKSAVRAVFPAPDSAHAVALLEPGDDSGKRGAFGTVPVALELPPRIDGTDAEPVAVAFSPAGDRSLVTVSSNVSKVYGTYVTRLPSLQVDFVPLASPPLATGIVPDAGVGYVAQLHPEGRITFIELETGAARTLTGFELGARVVD